MANPYSKNTQFTFPDREKEIFEQAKRNICEVCFYKSFLSTCMTCPVKKCETIYNRDINRITVRNGIKQNLIRFDRPSPVGKGTACHIGKSWFYFGDELSDLPPEEYMLRTDNESRVDWIYKALMALKEMRSPDYRYFVYFLSENLKED